LKNIGELCDDVSSSLAKLSRRCQTITLKVRYANFRTITRSRTLSRPTDDPQLIRETATSLSQVTEIGKIPVRLLGVSLSKFCTEVEAAEADADSSRQLFLAFD
jgi:DNA polymerase-4